MENFKYVRVKGGKQIKVYLQEVPYDGKTVIRESFVLNSEVKQAGRVSAECIKCRRHWMTNTTQTILFWKARLVNQDGSVCKEAWEYKTDKIALTTPNCPYCAERHYTSIPRTWRRIKGTYNPNVKCDARCLNATGHDCSCACGGANHGTGAVR